MKDAYWDRLASLFREYFEAGAEHPDAVYPDQELAASLAQRHADEDGYGAPEVATRDLVVKHGSGEVPVRVYLPAPDTQQRPVFVWVHGGAWAAGGLEGGEADATSREVASRAGAVVVSVDYRLAKDGLHYPVPLDDVVAAFRWAQEHTAEWGGDPQTVVLGGASAGANLAGGAALRLRDEGGPLPSSLALAYPAMHPRLPSPSAEMRATLDRMSELESFVPRIFDPIVENYLGAPVEQADHYAMPGLADDLTGLPPTYIFNCEFDGLRASGEEFARQLKAAGVPVVLETILGVGHGHLARPGLPQARQSHADLAAWVRDQTVPAGARRDF